MTKRWLSLVLVLTLLVSCFAAGASAEGAVRKGSPVVTFVPANTTITAQAGASPFSNKLLGEFRVEGSTTLSLADKKALSDNISVNSFTYAEEGGETSDLDGIMLDGNKLYASFPVPTAATGKADLVIAFKEDVEIAGYVTASLSEQKVATVSVYTAVKTAVVDETTWTANGKGATKVLTATVNGDNSKVADLEFVWASDAPTIVKVEQNADKNKATLTSMAAGKANISVTAKNKAGTAVAKCAVTVTAVESTSVTVSAFDGATAGERKQLVATIAPENSTDTVKSWSSSETSIATIDAKGLMTGIAEGTTIITVTTNGGKTHAPTVAIGAATGTVSDPVYELDGDLTKTGASVKITSSTVDAKVYYTMTTDGTAPAALTLANAATVGKLYDGAIALTENKEYKFNAIAIKGTAFSQEETESYEVDIAVTSFTLDKTAVTVNGKGEVTLTAKVEPANANVTSIDWTPEDGDAGVEKVEVLNDGKGFKLTTTGDQDVDVTATVTYGAGGTEKEASCKITVKPVVETEVTATPATLSIPAGQQAVLKATVKPANATYEKVDFYFTENSDVIAVVDADHGSVSEATSITIKALTTGVGKSETITLVSKNGLRTNCVVTVTAASSKTATPVFTEASGTTFTKAPVEDRTVHLTCATIGAKIKYTLNGGAEAVYNNGIEIPENKKAIIVAWAESPDGQTLQKSDTVTATFTSATAVTGVEDLTAAPSATIAGKGETVLTAALNPGTALNKKVTWKSGNTAVATIEQLAGEGNELKATVKAVKPGTAVMTVTTEDGNFTKTLQITVTDVTADGVKIFDSANVDQSGNTVTIKNGEAAQMTAKWTNGGADVKPFGTPVWSSSDNAVATVDNTGRVVIRDTAAADATATITVKLGTVSATMTAKVGTKPTAVAEVKLDPPAGEYTEEKTIKATTATDGAQLYYTLDGSAPTTSSTAFPAAGIKLSEKKTLRVAAFKSPLDPAYATALYTFDIDVSEVVMEKDMVTVTKGDTVQLKATVNPANATDKKIVWSITAGEEFATIDSETGILTAKAVGNVTVQAACGGETATCAVKIEDVKATGATLVPASATISVGDTKQLVAILQPAGLSGKTIAWTSSDEFTASVSDDGLVTARKAGTATITATVDGVKATATITVEAAPITIPAEPKKEVTFTPTVKEFKVIEGGSLSQVLGKLQPGEGETLEQIRYYFTIKCAATDPAAFTALNPVFDVAKDGTITLIIANVGSDAVPFSYEWELDAKDIPGFTPSADVANSGRTISGNVLDVVKKPTAINFTEASVEAFEMKGIEKKEVVVGKINNYADFVATKVDVKATITGADKGATVAIAADGTVTVTVTEIPKGEYTIVVTLTATGCDAVRTTGFKVTVTEDPKPAEKKIAIASATKPYDTMYKKTPVKVLNVADGTVTFSVPGYTATNWKSSKPKYISIDAVTGVATLNKPGSTTRFTISCMVEGTKLTQVVRIQKIATAMKMQYKDGKKWIDFADGTAAVKVELGKKLEIRAVNLTGSKRFSPAWATSDSAVVGPYKTSFTMLKGKALGTATVSLTLYNDVKAIIAIEVVPVGTKGAVESIEEEAIVEIEEIEELDMIEELED